MYAAFITTKLYDEPISLYRDHQCGERSSTAIAIILLGHTKGCQTIYCPFAGCEEICTGTLKVIVKPIKGMVVLASPGPAQTMTAFTDRYTIAQVTILSFITFSFTWICVLLCLKRENTVILVLT